MLFAPMDSSSTTRKGARLKVGPETRWALLFLLLGVGVGTGLPLVDQQLAGVIAGATIVYAGLTWRIAESTRQERESRREEAEMRLRGALLAALADLKADCEINRPQVKTMQEIFQDDGLELVRSSYLEHIPADLATRLLEASAAIRHYNQLATHCNATPETQYGHLDEALRKRFEKAHVASQSARDAVEAFLDIKLLPAGLTPVPADTGSVRKD